MGVGTERHGPVLLVRMEREHKRNAIDAALTAGLDAALNALDDDPRLLVGVLAGDAVAFSAGTDLAGGAGEPTRRGGNYGVVRRERDTPLVAAVEGLAYGGGFELVLACDLVVASRTARFALPETARGLVANCGALFRAQRALPRNIALEMLLTGEPLAAERAWSLGWSTRWSSRVRPRPPRSPWPPGSRRTGHWPSGPRCGLWPRSTPSTRPAVGRPPSGPSGRSPAPRTPRRVSPHSGRNAPHVGRGLIVDPSSH